MEIITQVFKTRKKQENDKLLFLKFYSPLFRTDTVPIKAATKSNFHVSK